MRIEHFAFNVKEPISIAAWYCEHLGFTIKHKFDHAPHTHFLADESGKVMIEIYCNPADQVPDYFSMDPLKDGSHLKMLKDPWGFSIQLCKRGAPMV